MIEICSQCTTVDNWILLGILVLIFVSILVMFYGMFVALPRELFRDCGDDADRTATGWAIPPARTDDEDR